MEKKRKCLQEITNTRKNNEIEYGYVVDDEEIINLDLIEGDEDSGFYQDFYIPISKY